MRVVRLDTSLELLLECAPRHAGAAVLATLVATTGSTYRKPGARMLILSDGSYVGLLSGGCLEADMRLHAEEVMATQVARAVEYDLRGPDDVLFGTGAGCEGAMRILLESADAGSTGLCALRGARQATATGESSVVIAVHEATDLPLGTYDAAAVLPDELRQAVPRVLKTGLSREVRFASSRAPGRAFVHFLPPPPRVLICGAGPDAQPVAAAAAALGWRVLVIDHRPAYAAAERFPASTVHCATPQALESTLDLARCHAVVIMSHHLASDVEYLRVLARHGEPGYIGLLGPRARRQRILAELGDAAAALGPRLYSPVGIDIGAATPEGIALAIVSQIHAWLAGRLRPTISR